MCDEGAAKTVMTRKLFDIIEQNNPSDIAIEHYEGSKVYSVTGPLQITGLATVKKVKINNETILDNVKILVANKLKHFNIFMGRDLITRTEKFKQPTDLLKAMVQQAEKEVLETSSGEDEKPDNHTIERSHQVQEFEVTRYDTSVSPESENTNITDFLSRLSNENIDNKKYRDFEDVLIAFLDHSVENTEQPESATEQINKPSRITQPDVIKCAEGLSSKPCSENTDEFEVYRQEQANDEDITWAIELVKLHKGKKPAVKEFTNNTRQSFYRNYSSLRVIKDLLYHESKDSRGITTLRFVLPDQSVAPVLKKIHGSTYGAHMGRKKSKAKMLTRFFRPNLRKRIENFVKTCHACQVAKMATTQKAPTQFLQPERTYQIVTSDYAGPFTKKAECNEYSQVMVDQSHNDTHKDVSLEEGGDVWRAKTYNKKYS